MTKENVIDKINEFLVDEFEVEEEKLQDGADFKKDLGIDSLDFVDIAVIIEQNFGLRIKGEEMLGVKTLGDFHNYVVAKLNLA